MPPPTTSAFAKAQRPWWSKRRWMWAALALLVVGASLFGLRRIVGSNTGDPVTHKVVIMPGLQPADRIAAAPGTLRDFNVLIITTDTTRADHLGCYGNRRIETPVIDGLAREGVLCAQAVTPSTSTLPAHSSLMTGLYPVHHGARANGRFRLEDNVTTLAERLKAKGYRTGAVISAFVLDSQYGLDQGFDLYNDNLTKGRRYGEYMYEERAAKLTNAPATAWLRENAKEKFFLWVHYFDPHSVYLPPEPFRSQYMHNPYDGEIAYVDSQIGVLLAQLETLGVRDKTLVIFTSDHGEGLGEHGEQSHSNLVYDSTLHVPLVFHAPTALPQAKFLGRHVCLVDVVPTLLSLLGEEAPEGLDGVNLCEAPRAEARPVLIETIAPMIENGWAPLLGVRRDDYKYIFAPTPELYDLRTDPKELENLHDEEPGVVEELSGALAEWLGEEPLPAVREAVASSSVELDDDARRHLAALGYLGAVDESRDLPDDLRDPKDMIVSWERIQSAADKSARGMVAEAIAEYHEALRTQPDYFYAHYNLAIIYRKRGQLELAEQHYEHALRAHPTSVDAHNNFGLLLLNQDRLDEAAKHLQQAVRLDPNFPLAHINLGILYVRQDRLDEAAEHLQQALRLDPDLPQAYNNLGMTLVRQAKLDEAVACWKRALELNPDDADAHNNLAFVLAGQREPDQAVRHYQEAVRLRPHDVRLRVNLGTGFAAQEKHAEAEAEFREALRLKPRHVDAHTNLGSLLASQSRLDEAVDCYRRAIQLKPRHALSHVELGSLLQRQGNLAGAAAGYRQALAIRPAYKTARERLQIVQKLLDEQPE